MSEDREKALANVTYAYGLVKSLSASPRMLMAIEALEAAQDALAPAEPVQELVHEPNPMESGFAALAAEPRPELIGLCSKHGWWFPGQATHQGWCPESGCHATVYIYERFAEFQPVATAQ